MADTGLVRSDGTQLQVLDRIQCDGHFATVKYIGEVPPTKGTWLGVDWDVASRGKHDGVHEGKRYFETRNPASGSFLRPKKAVLGVSCFEALRDRYGLIDDENAGIDTSELFVMGNKTAKAVEVVGAKKVNQQQSKLDTLKDIGLRETLVYGNGPGSQLKEFAPNITELNLSKNLLPSWQEVGKITKQLVSLRVLNVSDNVLLLPEDPTTLIPCFTRVKNLFINRMQYSWQQILKCSKMFPHLEQLHVCFNDLDLLSVPAADEMNHVTLLNMDCNNLSSWEQVLKVGHLPQLHTLMVSENNFESIKFPDAKYNEKTKYFAKVKTLYLMRNRIEDWQSINELNKLQSLVDLKMQGADIWKKMTDASVREQIIARVKNLQVCNSTKIREEERKGAAIDYLKTYGKLWKKYGGDQDLNKCQVQEEFLQQHPLFMEYVKKLGAPEDSELEVQSSAIKDNLLEVFVECPSKPEAGVVKKKLPKSMSVQKVKTLVQRLFKIETGDILLSYQSPKIKMHNIKIDNDLRQLSFYSIENGDTLLVKYN